MNWSSLWHHCDLWTFIFKSACRCRKHVFWKAFIRRTAVVFRGSGGRFLLVSKQRSWRSRDI